MVKKKDLIRELKKIEKMLNNLEKWKKKSKHKQQIKTKK